MRRERLTSINIPSRITTIGDLAFANCSGLTNITLNDGLKSLGRQALTGTSITTITIPKTVETLDAYPSLSGYSFAYKATKLKKAIFAEGIQTIPAGAFMENTSITEVVIPNSVTTIGGSAFKKCTGLTNSSLDLPDSITTIGDSSFDGCTGLTSIMLPPKVTTIASSTYL